MRILNTNSKNFTTLLFFGFLSFLAEAQSISPYITVDQFGYLPESTKIAVIRNPKVGFDNNESFSPGDNYALVNESTKEDVFTGSLQNWNGGQTDASSGDQVWWFDFSSVTANGRYYVLDKDKNVRSYAFQISPGVYNEVLKQAVRTFFYQRVGFKKEATYAGIEWADEASHVGEGQDTEARLFSSPNDASTEKDLSGGWYDAGDYNKYTSWTANYVVTMMIAYLEAPDAWGDDYNIPESGNGTPDLLDEAKWGIGNLLRMQQNDGSVLSIVSESGASPPSSATGQSLYGPATTSASLNTAAAFAIASKVFTQIGQSEYAKILKDQAVAAWDWAVANPAVLFKNNDAEYNSVGIGAGQQEESDEQRLMTKVEAAIYLFELTGEEVYRDFVDENYDEAQLIRNNHAYPFQGANQDMLLYYGSLDDATSEVKNDIQTVYKNAMNSGDDNFPAYNGQSDPYRAHLGVYTWGSNSVKSLHGGMFYNNITFNLDPSLDVVAEDAALGYIHYLHGTNPLSMVYLSNMYKYGGENCVNEFYHTWFANGSELWDRVGTSTYGPAPGFLVGGANPSYSLDGCCPGDCGTGNSGFCIEDTVEPPLNQPSQKSYKDWNTSWPQNSWSVTENSCGYQVNYIRLLSKFVDLSYDCNGDKDGSAALDECGNCAGGNTGVQPVNDPSICGPEEKEPATLSTSIRDDFIPSVYPNPTKGEVTISMTNDQACQLDVMDMTGRAVLSLEFTGSTQVEMDSLNAGAYLFKVRTETKEYIEKVIRQ